MFERFTDASRRLLTMAQEEARRLGHSYVGNEHLLLASFADEDWLSVQVAEAVAGPIRPIKRALEAVLRVGPGQSTGQIPLAEEGRQSLERAFSETRDFGHALISTGSILLGVLHDEGSAWVPLARTVNLTPDAVRQQVRALYPSSIEAAQGQNASAGPRPLAPPARANEPAADPVLALTREVAELRQRMNELERRLERISLGVETFR